MTGPPPAIYTIPAGVPFADALAQGILSQFADGDPLAISTLTILLPTRRAVRAVREAFLRVSGGTAMLLPQMRALGDADAEELAFGTESGGDVAGADVLELAPPIAPMRRQFLLMQLINAWGAARDVPYPPAATARLAAELARFLDQIETEQRSENLQQTALAALAPENFAAHWQETLEFLKIITAAWPEILREEGAMDPAAHRNAMLHALGARWQANPPLGPVIAAGSTGSVPATAELLEIISRMPRGMLVLPGLDQTLDARSWRALDDDPGHPQYGLARLLARLGVERDQVRSWPGHSFTANPARAALLSEALRPTQTTDAWREAGQRLQPQLSAALQGLSRIEAPAPREEAAAIALAMREVLETPGKTAALVTPDRGLARRVAVELGRWGIEADDSAGVPLAQTSVMVFIRALAAMVADEFAPVALLAANKHPLAAAGVNPAQWRRMTRDFERRALRGPRPAPGLAGLYAALTTQDPHPFVDRLAQCVAPLIKCIELDNCLFTDYLDALLETAENLAATLDKTGAERLWRGDEGDGAARFFADLREHAELCNAMAPAAFPALLDALLEGQAVRPQYGQHPRLFIWGPLEARLQHADRIILGGLNEGVWPATANVDPWLSRPMRQKFDLPAPERRIGLAAHDFVQAASGPDVILTRSRKRDGAPAAPSRWWLRIENLLAGLDARAALDGNIPWTDWAAALDMPDRVTPQPAPMPRPPVAARPRSLSVSDIAILIRDPYAIYARHVLGLRALDSLDTEIGAAERGTVIHEILEKFVRAHPGSLTLDDLTSLRIIGRQHFDELLSRPGVRAFWKPRFDDISDWFLNWDLLNRQKGAMPVGLEVEGAREFMAPAGAFRVRAIADRIDRTADGKLAIYDYKTGYNPNEKQIKAGFAPQLPLEGAIAQGGGFAGITAGEITKLALLRIRGIEPAGEEKEIPVDTIEEAWNGLRDLIARFDDPSTSYVSRRAPMFTRDNGDYDHLARVREWSGADSGDEE
jgi:ATP-dependent helicase/nuclease subunit B